jgi:hypothetical protein
MLDSQRVPAWEASILAHLIGAQIELALVILGTPEVRAQASGPTLTRSTHRERLFRLYERVDSRVFHSTPPAFAPTDMSVALASVPTIRLPAGDASAADEGRGAHLAGNLRDANLDVILHLSATAPAAEILGCARHGVWSYQYGDPTRYLGGPPFFWELYERDPVSCITLVLLAADPADARLLYQSFSATDPTSLHRSRNAAYWKAAQFMIRRLGDLDRCGPAFLEALPPVREIASTPPPPRGTPTDAQVLRLVADRAWAVAARRARRLVFEDRWHVAVRVDASNGGRTPWTLADDDHVAHPWRLLRCPPGRYYADPFVVEDRGAHFLFFEDYDIAGRRAVISWVALDSSGAATAPQTALERPYHLSYPFVFRWNGTWYMTPETAENRAVELYKAVDFPHRWELERVLIADISAYDPTLFEHDGLWWLFANVAAAGAPIADELCLFHAQSPVDPWTAHPMNPVVSDVRRARPAGRVFEYDGGLIRPGQDSSWRYGYATVFNRISTLTTSRYEEHAVGRLDPGWMPGNLLTHTHNSDGAFEVRDAFRAGLRWKRPPTRA